MTIFFVSIEFNYCCGISQAIFSLARELKARGHKIILGAPGGTMVEEFTGMGMEFVTIPVLPRKKNPKDFLVSIRRIRKTIKTYKVDVLHSHNRLADFLSFAANLLRDTPTVITAHALISGNKLLSFRSQKVIAVSNVVKDMLTKDFKVKPANILLARNIPRRLKQPSLTEADAYRTSLGVSKNEIVVAAVGRLHKEKGFDVLLDALKLYAGGHLKTIIVGKGEEEKALKDFAQQNDLDVHFINETKEVGLIYAVADMIVVPSRQESAGLVAIEAAFFKKPIIATRVGGLVETIQHNVTGLLVESENAKEMAAAIRNFATNGEFAKKMGQQVYAYVQKEYEGSSVAENIESLYRQLITRNGNGHHL